MSFEEKMSELKKPREMGEFGTEEGRDLQHALDIINELKPQAVQNDNAWRQLLHAKQHIDNLIQSHLEENKNK